ncbi:amino acid deaminase/aldolase [Corallococcus sp. H22C18031201]|uniref:amino acid deaminase/aldolase n=1 Tax=Citreicoccus inhibens TaxID=2849499 RepID=UPI000E72EE84|nr:amino acid deaminase/aldolase [Citreicoccus inhibens]MBU8898019.1 amino acid deaminase/aldolase [Citreicoccus inhibens]RJS15783.1 amino acid deaminase/aldolase [Corallococcus sp. H22C18031201]
MPRDHAYYAKALEGRRLPLAFVDLDLLKDNATALVRRAGGKPIRLATKSVRCVSLIRRVLETVPGFQGLMCYRPDEAVRLRERGLTNLLMGYPVVDPEALAELCRPPSPVTLMVDCAEHVELAARAAQRHGARVPLCLDVDLSLDLPGLWFGVYRSPVRTPEDALKVARAIAASEGVFLAGVMGYEAQLAGVPDASPFAGMKNLAVRALQRGAVRAVHARRAAIVRALADAGVSLSFVNGGGTGSLESTRADASVTELAAGSGLFSPALFDGYRMFRHQPAAAFAIPVTRRPAPGIFTLQGGGFVASGAAGPDKLPRPYLPEGVRLFPLEGVGEVQTPIAYEGPVPLPLGAPVFFRHAKAGELCEHFRTLLLLSEGRVVEEVPTYRGEWG